MVNIKNKFTKKALAFASAFIILCSILIIPCFAQAPDVEYSSNTNYSTLVSYTYDSDGLIYITMSMYDDSDDFTIAKPLTFVFTEHFYNTYYNGDVEIDFESVDIMDFRHSFYYTTTNYLTNVDGWFDYNDDNNFIDALGIVLDYHFGYNPWTFSQIRSEFVSSYNNQFLYWENEIEAAESNGYDDGLSVGYDEGYFNGYELGRLNGYQDGLSEGESLGYDLGYNLGFGKGKEAGKTEGYTNAINDYDYFARGIFTIFSAPFEFVRQLTFFDVFGIAIFPIFAFIILILLGFLIIKFVKGGIF